MSVIILESDKEIVDKINEALIERLNEVFFDRAKTVKELVRSNVLDILRGEDTFSSLLNGDLVGEFGFPKDSSKRLEAILAKIGESLVMTFYPFKYKNNKITGGYKFAMIKSDFSDIIKMTEAIVQTEKGVGLPWLEWLLTYGDSVIFTDYKIVFKNAGRSGMAAMVPSKTTGWRVPKEHSGTITNNWITRAIDAWIKKLESILAKELRGMKWE